MMKKRIALFFLAILILVLYANTGVFQVHAAAGDEIRAAKRIISVVYDDSGSMIGSRWSYTNYAMQALIALLNEQDELYMTFMSDPDTSVQMDTSNLSGTIKEIHDWQFSGSTPEEALDTARKTIGNIKETDATAQFWLVILTDGEIAMSTTLQEKLDSYKNNTMSNGTPLNVVYLGMGAAGYAGADTANHIYTYKADSDSKIISTLQSIAGLVSGRLSPDKSSQIDSKTISITSKLPLYSLSILSQKSDARVISAKTDEEGLNIQRNLALDATGLQNGHKIATLYGNASVIDKQNSKGELQAIPAGTYTISFSSDIDINNITIQVEPAIALKAVVNRDGVIIDDMSQLQNEDKVDINIIPVVPGTDEEIPDADLPKQISWNTEYEVDGNIVDRSEGMGLKGVTIKHGSNVLRGIINIPGYAPFVKEVYFNINEISYHFGIKKSPASSISYNRSDIKSMKPDSPNMFRFDITNNGKPLSLEEQNALGLTLKIDDISFTPNTDAKFYLNFGKTKVKCKLVQNEDGSYSLIPSCPFAIPALLLQAGEYNVIVSISPNDSITEKAVFKVNPCIEDLKDLPTIVISFLLIVYIFYLLFIKKKFNGQTVHYECWKKLDDGKGMPLPGNSGSEVLGFFSGGFIFPTRACSVKFHGLRLVAESGGQVIVTGESIAQTVVRYGKSTRDPKKHLNAIDKQMHSTVRKDGKHEASDQDLTSGYIYFKSTDNTDNIWRIWLTE